MKCVPQICALGVPQLAAWKETWVSLQSFTLPPELSHALDRSLQGRTPVSSTSRAPPNSGSLTAGAGCARAAPALQSGQGAATSLQSTSAGNYHPGAPGLTPQSVSLSAALDATLIWTVATDKNKWIKTRMSGSEVWLHRRFVLWPWFAPERACFISFSQRAVRSLW